MTLLLLLSIFMWRYDGKDSFYKLILFDYNALCNIKKHNS